MNLRVYKDVFSRLIEFKFNPAVLKNLGIVIP